MEKQHAETDFIKRILIVDDDDVDRYILRRNIISAMPAKEILEANSAEKALTLLGERAAQKGPLPELIFLDMNMSPMSGLEFLDVFEKLSHNIRGQCRIIMVCSKDDEAEKQAAMRHTHVAGYYLKPITPETLMRISDHINHKQAS